MGKAIEAELKKVLEIIKTESRIEGLERIGADESLVYGSGKLLRPSLAILSGRLLGCSDDALLKYAAAIELFHNSTLHHDDIIDSGVVRRGAPTINARYDNNFALLTGDYLVARSIGLLASGGDAAIVATMTSCYKRLVYGQLREMELDNRLETAEKDYYDVIDNKTASLIVASMVIGAQAAGAGPDAIRTMSAIGLITGRLFQVADDIFDLLGEEDETGKARFKDIREGKMTLAMIKLAARCGADEKVFLKEHLGNQGLTAEDGQGVVAMMDRYGVIKDIHNENRVSRDEALSMIGLLPGNEYRDEFYDAIDKICGRLYLYTESYL